MTHNSKAAGPDPDRGGKKGVNAGFFGAPKLINFFFYSIFTYDGPFSYKVRRTRPRFSMYGPGLDYPTQAFDTHVWVAEKKIKISFQRLYQTHNKDDERFHRPHVLSIIVV